MSPTEISPPYRFLADGTDRWLFANLPQAGRVWLPVKRPALNAALVIRRLAERDGVVLPMPVAGSRPAAAERLYAHQSPRLAEISRRLLEHSNNMAAEMVGLGTARHIRGGAPRSLAESVTLVDGWLKASYPAIDWVDFARANHSGLSPASRTTPRQMARLVVQALARVPELPEVLPSRELAENEGGRAKGKDEPASNPVYRAKSGTMAYARGLAGLLWTQSGKRLAFAVFVYDDERRIAFDATLDRRLPEMPATAATWLRRARGLERDLLRSWAASF
jgi:D-alanyl-D-alanine carboxypeptidase/D-alanyl-D-alanine-endopeptidase (penicillin-binding protein 4)